MSRIMSKFGGGLGGPSKDDRLNTAASLHIRLGNTQRYCELMVELGNVSHPVMSYNSIIVICYNISSSEYFYFIIFCSYKQCCFLPSQWEKALAVAPSVSLEYWKSLTER